MRGAQEGGQRHWRTAAPRRSGRVHERPPPGQNARLRGGVKMPRPHRERDRMALVSRASGPRQFPLRPYSGLANPPRRASSPVLPPRSLKPGASTVVRRRLCDAVGVAPDRGGSLLLHEDYGEPPVAEPSVDIDNAGCQPPPRPVLSRL